MRWVLILVTFVAADVCAASRPGRDVNRSRRSTPAFELLRAGSGVSHVHTNLDELFASEMVGNWWALRGDGTTAGPLALSAVGSPVAQTDRVCPNGPDCAAVESRRIDGTSNRFKTAATTSPTGDFSCWFAGRTDSLSTSQVMVAKDNNAVAGQRGLVWYVAAGTGRLSLELYETDSIMTGMVAPGGTVTAGENFLAVATYDFVASGSSVISLYSGSGSASLTVSTAKGPMQNNSDVAWNVGYRDTNANLPFAGVVYSAGCTEKVLSSTTIAAMASAVLPQVQGSRGETVTTTRSTVRACCNRAGCSLLPANRPCAQGAKLDVAGQRTNLLQQSEALNQLPPWGVNAGSPSMSGNTGFSPFGTLTADTLTDNDPLNVESILQGISTTAGTAYTCSVWARRNPSNPMSDFKLRLAGAGFSGAPGSSFTLTDEWVRYSTTATAVATATGYCMIEQADIASTGATDLFGAQAETGSVATPYCPTTTSSAVCGADAVSIARPTGLDVSTAGCVAATIVANGPQVNARIIGFSSSETPLYVHGTTTVGCFQSSAPINATMSASFVGRPVRLISRWRGTTCTVEAEGVSATGTLPSAFTSPSTIYVGSQLGTLTFFNGTISDVVFGSSPEACR